MARRSGGTHKGVEEKRRSLPIYQHYTLSPGKTKSHHPEAKCNHCLKEFVCGSKQRLIRHLRKCNSISNPEQIIAETLNTLARNSATGTLNHSILEASNLLPSQMPLHIHHHQLVGQQQPPPPPPQQPQPPTSQASQQQQNLQQHSSPNTANQNSSNQNNNNNNIVSNHNTSGSSNDIGLVAAASGNGAGPLQQPATSSPVKGPAKRGRKPGSLNANKGPIIQVTTGLDGKTHFTPVSQLSSSMANTVAGSPIIAQVHNGNGRVGYTYHPATAVSAASVASSITAPVTHLSSNSGHLACATPNHHSTQAYNKLNSDLIDKAYLKLVLTRNLPLSLCDTKEFQYWVKTFANDYKPPSSINLVTQNLKNEAQAAKQRISNILVKAPKKTINLELHSWPDQIRGHLWYAVIANIDLKRFLISVKDIDNYMHNNNNIINMNNISSTTTNNNNHNQRLNETGTISDDNLAEFIDDCIKRVGSDRVNSLLFSGASDGDLLAARARQSLYTTYPSIVTYYCWWHFTNLLCADIVERNEASQHLLRNSNRLIDFVNKRPKLAKCLEKFNPFAQVSGNVFMKRNDKRWYSHLVCYLLEFIKNNNEAITRIFGGSSRQSHIASSDNNNNSNNTNSTTTTATTNETSDNNNTDNPSHQGDSSHQQNINESTQASLLYLDDPEYIDLRSVILSSDFWSNVNLALVYLKPIQDLVALTSTIAPQQQQNITVTSAGDSHVQKSTPAIYPNIANTLLLSDYMNWILGYGQSLFNSWRQSPDSYKYDLIGHFLNRFSSSMSDFKLLFAAYLLNPKHRCAFMTQEAKNLAIEEILNIASEFMPEESDGHTIFDQWKLYLVREEPYDMVYEETRSNPLDWWMSIPCAESIRRVALRILRLKAFTSPKPDLLFSQLYFYEDETKTSLNESSYGDLAVLRYFYDFEDKVGQATQHGSSANNANNAIHSNGYHDRSLVGQLHNQLHNHRSNSNGSPETSFDTIIETNGQNFPFSNVVVDTYMNNIDHHQHSGTSIEDLPGYKVFVNYVDYNDTGVHIVEEPIEKKRRKWTAQEILSKCQSNNNNDINNK